MAQQTRARRVSVILTLLLLVGLAAGCGGTKPEPAKTSPPAAQGQAAVLSAQPGEWKPDGVIADKEYVQKVMNSGAERAQALALRTLRKVYKKIGFAAR